jgi:hypothetical protein
VSQTQTQQHRDPIAKFHRRPRSDSFAAWLGTQGGRVNRSRATDARC